jgi:hypothetical protein
MRPGVVELEQTCLVGYQAIFLNKMSSHLIVAETSVSRWPRFIGPITGRYWKHGSRPSMLSS